jgi:hypothetical protein
MTSFNSALAETLTALSGFWKRQGVACPPLDLLYVLKVSAENGVVLPPDFVQMYCALNGTPELYPNWVDDNFCSFLPIEALHTELKKLLVVTAEGAKVEHAKVTLFVNFMHHSWDYGFIADADGEDYQIGIMPVDDVFKVLTTSLKTFLNWYVEDADILYDSNYPASS